MEEPRSGQPPMTSCFLLLAFLLPCAAILFAYKQIWGELSAAHWHPAKICRFRFQFSACDHY